MNHVEAVQKQVRKVSGERFLHCTRPSLDYNPHPPLIAGQVFEVGHDANPFFRFYENAIKCNVPLPDGSIAAVPLLKFLKQIDTGLILGASDEFKLNKLPAFAAQVVQHYVVLVRELTMEDVRQKTSPFAPSRQRCLWGTRPAELPLWRSKLVGDMRIAELEVDGYVHEADASLLLGDSEPLSVTYDRAERYWRGEFTDNPERECLISGKVRVISIT